MHKIVFWSHLLAGVIAGVVIFIINDYMFEQLPGGVVVSIEAGFYSGPENRQRRLLQPEIVL